jgi:hypothetical protein
MTNKEMRSPTEDPPQVKILNGFTVYFPKSGVWMGVISRHKSLIFGLSSSSVIAIDKIYYATYAIHFLYSFWLRLEFAL